MGPSRAWGSWVLGVAVCMMAFAGSRASVAQDAEQGAWHKFTLSAQNTTADNSVDDAVCEIVYQVDDGIPGPRGYRYLFYGNGFFINSDGYMLTAAHVLGQLHGGQPYVLVRGATGKPHFVEANLVTQDHDHDVALLRATPNPFADHDQVSFLAIDPETAQQKELMQAASLSPSHLHDSYSLDSLYSERSPGDVLRFEFSKLYDDASDTELFLFNHSIKPGQSGSPVIADPSHAVAGIVEGEWLRNDALAAAMKDMSPTEAAAAGISSGPGAAVPIHYAIPLLQAKGVAWSPSAQHSSAAKTDKSDPGNAKVSSLPQPLSLVPVRYPDSLFGGEVLLSAMIDGRGLLSDIKVAHGDQPFAAEALSSARTWSFTPPTTDGSKQPLTITFQFPQPYSPPRDPTTHTYQAAPSATTADTAATPLITAEAQYPGDAKNDGSVILYVFVDREGRVTSAKALDGAEPLASSAIAAANQWKYSPARRAGQAVDSAAIVVVTFRRPIGTAVAPAKPRMTIRMEN
jgi:TonB family protein